MKASITAAIVLCLLSIGPGCTWIDEDALSNRMDLDQDGEPGTTDCDDNDPAVQLLTWYADSDEDGYGSAVSVQQCDQPSGYVSQSGDCDDGDSGVSPAVDEICNGFDDNCNGEIDDDLEQITLWPDGDGDGYGDPAGETYTDCAVSDGYIDNDADCDDNNDLVGAETAYYADGDADGYGDLNAPEFSCADLTTSGFTLEENATDCDDTRDDINPDMPEICDADDTDEDCDGFADDDDEDGAFFPLRWYPDNDGDGYGSYASLPQWSCDGAADEVDNKSDCHDQDVKRGEQECAWKYVATGKYQTCAITNIGTAACWGEGSLQPITGPYESLVVGDSWACGLERTGTLGCWADGSHSAATIPEALDGKIVVAVGSGFADACAATSDGEVICWGNDGSLPDKAPQGHYSAISAYGALFCGTRAEDGAINCWGPELESITNTDGRIDFGEEVHSLSAGSSKMTSGDPTICALSAENPNPDEGSEVRCLTEEDNVGWELDDDTPMQQVSVGGAMACTISTSHTLSCVSGQHDDKYTDVPAAPEDAHFTRVSVSYNHGCVITNEGSIGCWGGNGKGQSDTPDWAIEE